jgi:hypothetical protein
MAGAWAIITDPIFQGMAVSLFFGAGVATFMAVIVIPLGCISLREHFYLEETESGEIELSGRYAEVEEVAGGRARASISRAPLWLRLWGALVSAVIGVFGAISVVLRSIWRLVQALLGGLLPRSKSRPEPPDHGPASPRGGGTPTEGGPSAAGGSSPLAPGPVGETSVPAQGMSALHAERESPRDPEVRRSTSARGKKTAAKKRVSRQTAAKKTGKRKASAARGAAKKAPARPRKSTSGATKPSSVNLAGSAEDKMPGGAPPPPAADLGAQPADPAGSINGHEGSGPRSDLGTARTPDIPGSGRRRSPLRPRRGIQVKRRDDS